MFPTLIFSRPSYVHRWYNGDVDLVCVHMWFQSCLYEEQLYNISSPFAESVSGHGKAGFSREALSGKSLSMHYQCAEIPEVVGLILVALSNLISGIDLSLIF